MWRENKSGDVFVMGLQPQVCLETWRDVCVYIHLSCWRCIKPSTHTPLLLHSTHLSPIIKYSLTALSLSHSNQPNTSLCSQSHLGAGKPLHIANSLLFFIQLHTRIRTRAHAAFIFIQQSFDNYKGVIFCQPSTGGGLGFLRYKLFQLASGCPGVVAPRAAENLWLAHTANYISNSRNWKVLMECRRCSGCRRLFFLLHCIGWIK